MRETRFNAGADMVVRISPTTNDKIHIFGQNTHLQNMEQLLFSLDAENAAKLGYALVQLGEEPQSW